MCEHFPVQVLQEVKTDMSTVCEEVTQEEREAWEELAVWYLHAAKSKHAPKTRKVKDRVASFHALRAIDQQLRTLCGQGLAYWSALPPLPNAPAAQQARAGQYGVLTFNSDCGPDMQCVKWFLKGHMRLQLMDFDDPAHCGNADLRMAVSKSGILRPMMLLNATAYRVNWGPFSSSAWHHKILEGGREFVKRSGPNDPYFLGMLPALARDVGMEERLPDPEFPQFVWDSIVVPGTEMGKGHHLQYTRFNSMIDTALEKDPWWHVKLMFLEYIGLREGYLRKTDKSIRLVLPKGGGSAEDAGGKETTAASAPGSSSGTGLTKVAEGKENTTLRALTKNKVHQATVIMMNDDQQNASRVIARFGSDLRRWMGKKMKGVRSVEASMKYYVGLAEGSWMEHIVSTLKKLTDLEALSYCGLQTRWPCGVPAGAVPEAVLAVEDEWAKVILDYVVNIVFLRCRRCLPHSYGFPHAFAGLLSENEDVRQKRLAFMGASWGLSRQRSGEPMISS